MEDEAEEDEEEADLEEEEGEEEGDDIDIGDDVKRHILQKCLTSWFGRKTVTTSVHVSFLQ